ncbi:hypothetical protein PR048_008077 [Dryococelus australis]|uniref:Uncharacterized protein n=1 Tax=Dryococelus australis TaxID=614101 RepID=A0ABQ9HW28_9NEOP|nr:hypothetical protein PR048_008077 [Dryococelus australis]
MRPGKSPRAFDCSKCRWKSTEDFYENARKKLCSEYWQLEYCWQKDFIIHNISSLPPKTQRIRTGTGKERKVVGLFFCKRECEMSYLQGDLFKNTWHQPWPRVVSELGVFTGYDQRGRHEPQNKTIPEVIETSTKREYLNSQLSINKMYELYVEQCREKARETKIEEPAPNICRNYNLSFFNLKKAECITCNNYSDKLLKDEMKTEYRANHDKTIVSATLDLQSVLQIPASTYSQMYYSRKIYVYNLTVYEATHPHKAWSDGQRGSCEIGTALLQWTQQLPDTVTEMSVFSETCSGQNRSQFISALFLYAIENTNVQIAEHNIVEKGHTYMEVYSTNSAIETARRNVKIYTMNGWLNVFILARSTRGKHKTSGNSLHDELERRCSKCYKTEPQTMREKDITTVIWSSNPFVLLDVVDLFIFQGHFLLCTEHSYQFQRQRKNIYGKYILPRLIPQELQG